MMSFPNHAYRGISSIDYVNFDEEIVHASAFQFSQTPGRDDFLECSINWADDMGALKQLAMQRNPRKQDCYQFIAGACRVPRSGIEHTKALAMAHGLLSYERSPLDDNKYHGNLLCSANANKKVRKMIEGAIALAVDEIIPRETMDAQI